MRWCHPLELSVVQAIELAKTPRAPTVNSKTRDKGKGKAKDGEPTQAPQLEYHDGTLHDSAIRAHLMRGYEQFKVGFMPVLVPRGADATWLSVDSRFLFFDIVFLGTTSFGAAARAILYCLGVDMGSRQGL